MLDALYGLQRQQAGFKVPATARQPAPSTTTAPAGARGRGWVHGCERNVTSGLMISRADHHAARSSARHIYTFGKEPGLSTARQKRLPAHEGWAGGVKRAGVSPRVGCIIRISFYYPFVSFPSPSRRVGGWGKSGRSPRKKNVGDLLPHQFCISLSTLTIYH